MGGLLQHLGHQRAHGSHLDRPSRRNRHFWHKCLCLGWCQGRNRGVILSHGVSRRGVTCSSVPPQNLQSSEQFSPLAASHAVPTWLAGQYDRAAHGSIVTLESACQIEPDIVDASGVVPPSAVPGYTRAPEYRIGVTPSPSIVHQSAPSPHPSSLLRSVIAHSGRLAPRGTSGIR